MMLESTGWWLTTLLCTALRGRSLPPPLQWMCMSSGTSMSYGMYGSLTIYCTAPSSFASQPNITTSGQLLFYTGAIGGTRMHEPP